MVVTGLAAAWRAGRCFGRTGLRVPSPALRAAAKLFVLATLAGCATVPMPAINGSDRRATRLLQQAANVQGAAALSQLKEVKIHYDAKWGADIVARVQPVLVDKTFRGNSVEWYSIPDQKTVQVYEGPAGLKQVSRTPGNVQVWYKGKPSTDHDVLDAAALVADGYRMFLLGPAFFLERHAVVQYLGSETIGDFDCDNLLAVLRPGIGRSVEDRIIISIDKRDHLIRRFRMTVEGMDSTKGAVADVFPQNYIRVDGVDWPTIFDEELKSPFDVNVHHWRVVQIDRFKK
jgi:hypothetical protein